MKTIDQMKREIGAIMKDLGDMKALCETENRMPNDEERNRATTMLDQVEMLEQQIKLEQRAQDVAARMEKKSDEPVKQNPDDKESRAAYKPQDRKERFLSFGEQLASVIRAGAPGGSVDPRLNNRAATGLSESVPSDGGFLVQTDFASEIIARAYETAQVANRCRKIQISSNSNSLKMNGIDETSRATGSRWGGVRGYWVAEAGEKTATKPKFRQIELNLRKLCGLCYLTDELLQDTTALEGVVRQAFSDEISFLVDDAIIRGTGVGQPLGILESPALVTHAKVDGQSNYTVIFGNIIGMWARLWVRSQQNAVWFVNQQVLPQLYSMTNDITNPVSTVFLPPGGATGSMYSTLMGRPVIPIEQATGLGSVGDILLADMSQYLLCDKGGLQTDTSIHVRFVYDESVLRFVYRVDGQPMWSSALTPYKAYGTATVSPFIALAART